MAQSETEAGWGGYSHLMEGVKEVRNAKSTGRRTARESGERTVEAKGSIKVVEGTVLRRGEGRRSKEPE